MAQGTQPEIVCCEAWWFRSNNKDRNELQLEKLANFFQVCI